MTLYVEFRPFRIRGGRKVLQVYVYSDKQQKRLVSINIGTKKELMIFLKTLAKEYGAGIKEIKNKIKDNPVRIYENIEEIRAIKGNNSLWPKDHFKHKFRKGAEILGNNDGSLTIRSKNGKRLWKEFDY